MTKRLLMIAALLLGAACAEELPGIAPPEREVYFPIGMQVVSTAGAGDVLVVSSSNFDQRYNAGYVSTYSVAQLLALAGTGESTTFVDSLDGPAFLSRVRIEQFGGDLVYAEPAGGGPGRIFVPSRGRNLVTMIALGDDGVLSCDAGGLAPRTEAFDCTAAHEIRTFADDPFPLALAPPRAQHPRGALLVGHLTPRSDAVRSNAFLASMDVAAFEARLSGQVVGRPFDPELEEDERLPADQFQTIVVPDSGGVGGVAWSASAIDGDGAFLISSAGSLTGGAVSMVAASFTDDGTLTRRAALLLDLEASIIQTRGIRISETATRAYVSVRFAEGQTISQFNAGIAIVDISTSPLRLVSVFEVGEELARPSLLERNGARLLYLPDIRRDRIFIVDVTTDAPSLVGSIPGRANRTIDGKILQARTLASPPQVAFTSDEAYGFVANFANSTISVIDVSDPDPRAHRLIARLGRNIDAEGDEEMPE